MLHIIRLSCTGSKDTEGMEAVCTESSNKDKDTAAC